MRMTVPQGVTPFGRLYPAGEHEGHRRMFVEPGG